MIALINDRVYFRVWKLESDASPLCCMRLPFVDILKHLDLVRLGETSGFDASLEEEFHESFRTEGVLILRAMDEALEKGNIKEFGEQAHKLKGSALTIGYPEIASTTLRMETICKANNLERAALLLPKLKRQMLHIDALMGEYFSFHARLSEGPGESKKER